MSTIRKASAKISPTRRPEKVAQEYLLQVWRKTRANSQYSDEIGKTSASDDLGLSRGRVRTWGSPVTKQFIAPVVPERSAVTNSAALWFTKARVSAWMAD